jgi:hypothetical protein
MDRVELGPDVLFKDGTMARNHTEGGIKKEMGGTGERATGRGGEAVAGYPISGLRHHPLRIPSVFAFSTALRRLLTFSFP